MPKFDWDEFAGGLAKGGVAGMNAGTDLFRAREAARLQERGQNIDLLQDPDFGELIRRRGSVPGGAFSAQEGGTEGLVGARGAASNILAASPGFEGADQEGEDIARELGEIRAERRKSQLTNESMKSAAGSYRKTEEAVVVLRQLRARARAAAQAARSTEERLIHMEKANSYDMKIAELKAENERAEMLLDGLGVTAQEKLELLRHENPALYMEELMEKKTGSPGARRPGTRGR